MTYEFPFPDIGEGIQEGKILQWRCGPGDTLREGDILAAVETDKVVAEIPSPRDGVLLRRGAEEGQIIQVGEMLATIEVDGDGDSGEAAVETSHEAETGEGSTVVGYLDAGGIGILPSSGEGVFDGSADDVSLVETPPSESRRAIATPVARKLASDSGIDISALKGSGPAGRIMKQDVVDAVEKTRGKAGDEAREDRRFTLSTVRKTIARNLEASQRIPTATVHESVVVDELVRVRDALNGLPQSGTDVPRFSFLPFFFTLTARALREFEIFNATFDAERDEVTVHGSIHMGFAVDTGEGLVVPVIRDVNRLSLSEVQREVSRLIDSARSRTLTIEDIRGGTFTVSVYGSIGGLHGSPMILPPQVAILGIGRIHPAPAVIDGAIRPAHMLPISLVIDHRVIDGATASRFVNRLMTFLSTPSILLADQR
jgi:pyruvate dehydrogenase E2 component (dihydrolipoamide acetyltransferase)